MNEFPIGHKATWSIWWSAAWRASIVAIFYAALVGTLAVLSPYESSAGYTNSLTLLDVSATVWGMVGAIPISLWALKVALSKQHGGCCVRLTSSQHTTPSLIDYKAVLPIWWAVLWRYYAVGITLGFVVPFVVALSVVLAGGSEQMAENAAKIAIPLLIFPMSLLIGVWALKVALSKKHKGYSVRLVKEPIAGDASQG